MKKFTKDYNIGTLDAPAFMRYFGNLKPCVFDIETTGLSPDMGRVILTAMLIPNERGVTVTQFLAEDHYDEYNVLQATLEFMEQEQVGYLITYNGANFDIPFTNKRLYKHEMDSHLWQYDLDMYRLLKSHSVLPEVLDSMSQKRVEHYFGFGSVRQDTISGRESVRLYNEYAQTGDSVIEKVILTHNREDVVQLYKVLNASAHHDFSTVLKQGDIHSALAGYSFPICDGQLTVRPAVKLGALHVAGRQARTELTAARFACGKANFHIEFNGKARSYQAILPLRRHGKSYYSDLAELDFDENVYRDLNIESLPGYVNNYLILVEDGTHNHAEINALSTLLITSEYKK